MTPGIRAAVPDPSPRARLLRALDASLRAEQRDRYAGMALGADGAVEVFAVGPAQSTLVSLVERIHSVTAPEVTVRVIADRQHGLASLEELQRRVTASAQRLRADGIELVEWGIDIRANRLRLGVEDLSSDVIARLEAEFDRTAVRIVRGQRFRAC